MLKKNDLYLFFLYKQINHYLYCLVFLILVSYTLSFDCTCFPIIKKLFEKKNHYNKYNKKNFITREIALRDRRYKLSKFQIDKTAADIVGPKKNNTNTINNIDDYSSFLNDSTIPSNY